MMMDLMGDVYVCVAAHCGQVPCAMDGRPARPAGRCFSQPLRMRALSLISDASGCRAPPEQITWIRPGASSGTCPRERAVPSLHGKRRAGGVTSAINSIPMAAARCGVVATVRLVQLPFGLPAGSGLPG